MKQFRYFRWAAFLLIFAAAMPFAAVSQERDPLCDLLPRKVRFPVANPEMDDLRERFEDCLDRNIEYFDDEHDRREKSGPCCEQIRAVSRQNDDERAKLVERIPRLELRNLVDEGDAWRISVRAFGASRPITYYAYICSPSISGSAYFGNQEVRLNIPAESRGETSILINDSQMQNACLGRRPCPVSIKFVPIWNEEERAIFGRKEVTEKLTFSVELPVLK